jgi:protoporphyrinogen oxidase
MSVKLGGRLRLVWFGGSLDDSLAERFRQRVHEWFDERMGSSLAESYLERLVEQKGD